MRYAFSNVFEDPFWLTTVPMALVGWIVALVGSILNSVSYSSQFPVFSWWGVAFEMVAIILTLHAAFSNEIRMYRLAILSCLAIATVYTTNSTNNFVWRDNSSSGAAAAGNILLSIINIVWILYFGTTQDEPVHMYIESFAAHKKMSPQSEFQKRMREKRRNRMTGGTSRYGSSHRPATNSIALPHSRRPSALGTASQPYRMSDVLQSINIGDPTGFNRQTDTMNPSGHQSAHNRMSNGTQSQAPSNPLSSTYLYSVDQLHRHGLASHEVELDSPEAGMSNGHPSSQDLTNELARNASTATHHTGNTVLEEDADLHRYSVREDPEDDLYDQEDMFKNMQPVAKARARFSYAARTSDGEIPFKEGEVLDVCDMTGNWWYCRRENGEVGICPRNYLDLLDEPLL